VGLNILELGYCVHPDKLLPENHPEQGPVWEWVYKNRDEVMNRLTSNFRKEGPGAMRKIPDSVLDEIKKIFDVTGGTERFEKVRKISVEKAKEEGLTTDEDIRKDEYFKKAYCCLPFSDSIKYPRSCDSERNAIIMSPGTFPLGQRVLQLIHSPQYQIVSLFSNFSISSSLRV